MTIKIAVGETTARTTTGTQDLDCSSQLGTMVPKAVLIMASLATSLDSAVSHGVFAMGAGTYYNSTYENRATSGISEDGQGSSVADTYRGNNAVIAWKNPTQANYNAASLSSFSAGKATINWFTRDDSTAVRLTYMLFADDGSGDTLTARVGDIEPNTSENGDVTITPGFESELIFWIGRGRDSSLSLGANAELSFGAYNGTTQVARTFWEDDASGTTDIHGRLFSDKIGARGDIATTRPSFEAGNITSTSFDITTRDEVASTSWDYFYLSLNLSGLGAYVALVDSPTSTGNEDYTGPGWQPMAWIWAPTFQTATGGWSDGDSFSLGLLADGGDACFSISAEDGVGTTDTQSLASSAALEHPQHDGTAGLKATFSQWLSTGAQFNFSTVDSSARKLIAIAIENPLVVVEDSVSADAVIQRTPSPTLLADAVVKRVPSATVTADGVIFKTTEASVTGDGVVKKTEEETVTADAWIQVSGTEVDSFLADAVLKNTYTPSILGDAVIKKLDVSGSITADAFLEWIIESSFDADAVILRTSPEYTFTADAHFVSTGTHLEDFTANAVIAKYDLGSTITADAIIAYIVTSSVLADSVIKREGVPGSFTADAMLRWILEGSLAADSVIKREDVPGTFDADAHIVYTSEDSVSADAVVKREGVESSVLADAVFKRVDISGSITGDAHIVYRTEDSLTADAFIYVPEWSWIFADAVIQRAGVAGSVTGDSVVRRVEEDSVTADAYIIWVTEAGVLADSVIFKTTEGSLLANACISAANEFFLLASAAIKRVEAQSITADAYILGVSELSGSVDADAVILQPQPGSVDADAVILQEIAGSLYADAVIKAALVTVSGTFRADAFIAPTAPADAPAPGFRINDTAPPQQPHGGGYILHYPKTTGKDGKRRGVGAVGRPWIEITYSDCLEDTFEFYDDLVTAGEESVLLDSVQYLDPYAPGGAEWVLATGDSIRLWRPTTQEHMYGYYTGVRIIISGLG